MIHCKRAYVPAAKADGQRLLLDRLWPRGCSKDSLALQAWLPDLAPSTALRKAFKGNTIDFAEFRQRYRNELAAHPEHCWALLAMAGRGHLTLVYAAQDECRNNARVLAEWLEEELQRLHRPGSPTSLADDAEKGLNGAD
ncbi:DUF488 domain-containing protein [Stutzerimonas stutzeri]|uniref:MarR family transcriptional regulator n=1 Tax=Stutzerimonas stutzeri KOS6 TaxID=1218352 RepID=A0A061JME1_STUST|nr:DUF488 family protein [Stutzerimonas stutzeri]EWC39535.1 hypothetical protein B597_019800 [Stutzerimonas stutzeri KOS6]